MENFHFKLFSLSELMYRVKFLNLLRAKNDDKKKLCNSNEGCKLLKLHIYIYIYYIERKMLSDSMLYLSAACSIFSEWLKILFFFCFSALCAPFLLSSHGSLPWEILKKSLYCNWSSWGRKKMLVTSWPSDSLFLKHSISSQCDLILGQRRESSFSFSTLQLIQIWLIFIDTDLEAKFILHSKSNSKVDKSWGPSVSFPYYINVFMS